MWHGGYDQSITSSAARAPHTAPILPGPLPFARYTSAAAGKNDEREEGPRGAAPMHAYKFACRLYVVVGPRWKSSMTRLFASCVYRSIYTRARIRVTDRHDVARYASSPHDKFASTVHLAGGLLVVYSIAVPRSPGPVCRIRMIYLSPV